MRIPLKYNWRNLRERRGTTLLTVSSIAFVVLVYVGVLSMAGGLRQLFAATGDARNILVVRDGALSEGMSFFELDKANQLAVLPGVGRGKSGKPLASGQVVVVQILKRRDGSENNITLRGIEPAAFEIYPQLTVTSGRSFEPGKSELIVGEGAAGRFQGLEIGDELKLNGTPFRIVGHFAAPGGTFSSEIWGASADLLSAYRRSTVSSAIVQAASEADADALFETIRTSQQIKLKPIRERDYFADQTKFNSARFVALGSVLAMLLSFGACFAAANTMYAQVSFRARELGTLRAMGFRRRTILATLLLEAAVLGLAAGLLGALLALPLNAINAGMMNSVTFSEISFRLRTSPDILIQGLILAVLTAVIGGFPAAWSATRQRITTLLREG